MIHGTLYALLVVVSVGVCSFKTVGAAPYGEWDPVAKELQLFVNDGTHLFVWVNHLGKIVLEGANQTPGQILDQGYPIQLSVLLVEKVVANGGPNGDTIDLEYVGDSSWHPNLSVEIHGNGGDDVITGSGVGDTIYCGPGNDIAYGKNGVDDIHGEQGVDAIYGTRNVDTISQSDLPVTEQELLNREINLLSGGHQPFSSETNLLSTRDIVTGKWKMRCIHDQSEIEVGSQYIDGNVLSDFMWAHDDDEFWWVQKNAAGIQQLQRRAANNTIMAEFSLGPLVAKIENDYGGFGVHFRAGSASGKSKQFICADYRKNINGNDVHHCYIQWFDKTGLKEGFDFPAAIQYAKKYHNAFACSKGLVFTPKGNFWQELEFLVDFDGNPLVYVAKTNHTEAFGNRIVMNVKGSEGGPSYDNDTVEYNISNPSNITHRSLISQQDYRQKLGLGANGFGQYVHAHWVGSKIIFHWETATGPVANRVWTTHVGIYDFNAGSTAIQRMKKVELDIDTAFNGFDPAQQNFADRVTPCLSRDHKVAAWRERMANGGLRIRIKPQSTWEEN